jgi:hypothetical protein
MTALILSVLAFVVGYYVGGHPEQTKAGFLSVLNRVKTVFSKKAP